jgi:NAD(P)-dependent dehydrogenase (short-subunit alcohol dehydrogenase family)
MLLKDKVVIISGVGPGMGQTMAKIAAAEGALVGMGARNQDFLDEVAKDIRASGGKAIGLSTDVTDSAQCRALAGAVVARAARVVHDRVDRAVRVGDEQRDARER